MIAALFFSAAALFLLLALHPFVFYPLSLRLIRSIRGIPRDKIAENPGATYAICMSAYNEEKVICRKIENLLRLRSTVDACDILVYVDAASDRTSELLARFGDQIKVLVGRERLGKSHGLNELIKLTRADIIVFTDANTEIDEMALRRIGARFADPNVGCVCGNLISTNDDENETATASGNYWRLEERIKQLESDTFGIIGADGSLFAIRRSLHEPVPPDIIDDFFVSMRILLQGYRVVREGEAIAFERSATDDREEFARKIRIACQAFNVHKLIWGDVRRMPAIAYCYVSHRLLKWLIVYNLGLAGLFLVAGALVTLPAALIIGLGVCAGFSLLTVAFSDVGPAKKIRSMSLALLGVGIGVMRSATGERYQTWQPMTTARS